MTSLAQVATHIAANMSSGFWRMEEREDGADVCGPQYRIAVVSCIEDCQDIVLTHNTFPALAKAYAEALEVIEQCKDYAHNPFEPDNQSNHYKRLSEFLARHGDSQ